MMHKALILLITLWVLAACTPEEMTPTQTPTSVPPTATPIPADLDALNWHLQFASDSDTALFRCRVLPRFDQTPRNLMNPVSVKLTSIVVTPQILQEVARIYSEGAVGLEDVMTSLQDNPENILVLLRLDFEEERDIDESFQMLIPSVSDVEVVDNVETENTESGDENIEPESSPTADAETENINVIQNTLRELRFGFGSAIASDQPLFSLTLNSEQVFAPDAELGAFEAEVGTIYPFVFNTGEFAPLGNSQIDINIKLEMFVPFISNQCQIDQFQQYDLAINLLEGDSRRLPQLLGDEGLTNLSDEELADFRLSLLTDILPTFSRITENTNIEEAQPTITATPEDN